MDKRELMEKLECKKGNRKKKTEGGRRCQGKSGSVALGQGFADEWETGYMAGALQAKS